MNQIEVIDATTPVELGVAEEVIAGLKGRLAGLDAGTHQGYMQVKSGISELTRYRTGVDKSRKALKKSALDWGRKVESEARRVTGLLLEIETPLREKKALVDDQAERKLKIIEEAERLAIEAKELAEKKAREAEEEAKREEERKERESAAAKLAEDRKELEDDRRKMKERQLNLELELQQKNAELAAEREKIEADKRAILKDARLRELVEREEAEAVEAAEQKVRDDEERTKTEEAEKIRLAKEESERERIAEEQLPDREKLKDFALRIGAVEPPRLGTVFGNGVLACMCRLIKSARDLA